MRHAAQGRRRPGRTTRRTARLIRQQEAGSRHVHSDRMAAVSPRRQHAQALFAPLGPTYDRYAALLSFGQDPRWRRFLVSRDRGRPGRHGARRRHRHRRGRARADPAERLPGRRPRPEPPRCSPRRGGALPGRRVRLVEGEADQLPFADGVVRRAHLHVPAALRRRPRRDARASWRGSCRPGGTIAGLEFGVPPTRPPALGGLRPRRPAARRPTDLAGLGRGRLVPRPEHRGLLGASRSATCSRCGARPGSEDVRVRRLSLGGGIVIWGRRRERRGAARLLRARRREAGATTSPCCTRRTRPGT